MLNRYWRLKKLKWHKQTKACWHFCFLFENVLLLLWQYQKVLFGKVVSFQKADQTFSKFKSISINYCRTQIEEIGNGRRGGSEWQRVNLWLQLIGFTNVLSQSYDALIENLFIHVQSALEVCCIWCMEWIWCFDCNPMHICKITQINRVDYFVFFFFFHLGSIDCSVQSCDEA